VVAHGIAQVGTNYTDPQILRDDVTLFDKPLQPKLFIYDGIIMIFSSRDLWHPACKQTINSSFKVLRESRYKLVRFRALFI
jgi:hypothetical protein